MPARFATYHADDQLLARYLHEAAPIDWTLAFLDVTDNRSVLLARQQDGCERHIVKVGRVAAVVVYSPDAALFYHLPAA